MHSSLMALVLGAALGLRHATEADHVVAVTTMVSRERRALPAAGVGALWGLGHSIALIVLGGTLILLGVQMPPRLAAACDGAVAAMLILLGAAVLLSLRRRREVARAHTLAHALAHTHGHDHRHPHPRPWWRATLVGFVHGASGTAALTLLLLTTIRSRWIAVATIALFGAGSIAGMALLSVLLALPFAAATRRAPILAHSFQLAAGIGSLALGALLALGVVRL